MKKLLMILILISTSSALFAKGLASKPEFEENYIKMAAKGFLCGGITLKPRPDFNVRVMSQHFYQPDRSTTIKPGKVLSRTGKEKKKSKKNGDNDWIEVGPGGMRVRYDSAGLGLDPSSHYRVFCQMQNEKGNWRNTECSKVLILEDIKHNRPCVGPGGPSASYSPLNMQTK